jgi:hypothetical protein
LQNKLQLWFHHFNNFNNFKTLVVDDDEVAKVKDDGAPANTCTNNTNSLDKEDLLCTQLQLLE